MRYIRFAVVLLFILCIGLYGTSRYMEVKNADPTKPSITSSIDILEIPCAYTDKDLFSGLKAWDDRDGDLTGEIMLGNLSRFHQPGQCKATYVVFDSGNQPALFTRNIIFTDYRSPWFTLSRPLVFARGTSGNIQDCIGAQDMLNGDISDFIRITDYNINYSVSGNYYLDAEITNSFGDLSEISLPVHIEDASKLVLQMELENPLVYLKQGDYFSPSQYRPRVSLQDGTDPGSVKMTIISDVNTDLPGCYEVCFTAVNEKNQTGTVWQIVVVE